MINIEIMETGRATVTLQRPEMHNAFDEALIAALHDAFTQLGENDDVRCIVLAAEGRSFSAGADLNWMKRMSTYTQEQNLGDANALAAMLHAIATCPKPTIAAVQGPCYGGGVGLAATCDMAIASEEAAFSLSEVKLGLIPATIAPYVVAGMGERMAHRYFLSGERFDAMKAYEIGFVHDVVPMGELDAAVDDLVATLLKNGPAAMATSKALIFAVANKPVDQGVLDDTAKRIADIRGTDEGKEGIAAFLEKRKPNWIQT